MNQYFVLLIISVFLFFSTCSKVQKNEKSLTVVNIEANVNNMKIVNLSQFTDDIQYIPLESNKNFPFTGISQIDISGKYILISNMQNCLLFDSCGRLISKIGSNGRGPGEYLYVTNIGLSFNKDSNIYLSSLWDVFEYKINGEFKNKYTKTLFINDDIYLKNWRLIDDSLFFGHVPNGSGQVEYKAIIIDKLGSIMNKYKNYILFKRDHVIAGGFENYAHIYLFKKTVFYKELFNDTLFSLSSKYELLPEYFFHLGSLKMPLPERAQSPFGEILWRYISVFDVFQTEEYLFLNCLFGYRFPAKRLTPSTKFPGVNPSWYNTTYILGIYNKKNRELIFCKPSDTDNPLYTSGIYNDIDCGPRFFPILMVNDSTMVMTVRADDLKAHVASNDFKNNNPKYPEKKKKLEQLADSISMFDNPVIMMVTFKNKRD